MAKSACVEVLMEGLKHLEYRGYDSAGLALQVSGRIEVIKQAGHINKLPRPSWSTTATSPGAGQGGSYPLGDARTTERG